MHDAVRHLSRWIEQDRPLRVRELNILPVLYGDWGRFIIRHVPTEAVVIRYDELFMANMQRGYEMLFRADARIMHAGGSGDDPIKALKCPA